MAPGVLLHAALVHRISPYRDYYLHSNSRSKCSILRARLPATAPLSGIRRPIIALKTHGEQRARGSEPVGVFPRAADGDHRGAETPRAGGTGQDGVPRHAARLF